MTRTMLLGIGNAGCNITEYIHRETKHTAIKEALYVLADCNEDDLFNRELDGCRFLLLDRDKNEFPSETFDGIEKLVIVAGLGGRNTGTIFAELAAKCAREHGVEDVVVIAVLPFSLEGEKRIERAISAAKRIKGISGVRLFCLNNEELVMNNPDLDIFTVFKAADEEILKILEKTIENSDTLPVCELHNLEWLK